MSEPRTSEPRRRESLLHRSALGLWLCVVALLGFVQFLGRAFEDGAFAPGFIAWLWAGGSALVGAIGVALVLRALRR